MKVLVTGAAGYIGRHVVKQLLDMGQEVIAVDLRFDGVDARAKQCSIPIFSEDKEIYQKLGKPDVCIHLAWRDGFVHFSEAHMADLSKHIAFCNYMMAGGLPALAVMGTMHEVGYWEGSIDENTPCNPLSQYGIAKNAMRQSLMISALQYGCCLYWLRGFYITGDESHSNSIFAKITKAEQEGKSFFPFTSGKNQYDFVDVDTLATMIAAASLQKEIMGIINLCTGTPISLAEKVESYIKEKQYHIRLQYGVYPERPYDSPSIWGNATKICKIMNQYKENSK